MKGAPLPPFGLCGSLSLVPVRLGACMHEAGYRALGLPFRYMPFAATSASLASCVGAMRSLGIRGLGVSMPFKIEVLPLLDAKTAQVERIGAANTLVNDGGHITGHNTDASGAARALSEAMGSLAGARALVLGAGGAARAVVVGLLDAGVAVTVCNRTRAKGQALAAEFGAAEVALAATGSERFDVIINASSAGMDVGDVHAIANPPFSAEQLKSAGWVMDIVYKPIDTPLLRLARSLSKRTVHGGRMLLHQAALQFELYTETTAPLAAMHQAQLAELARREFP